MLSALVCLVVLTEAHSSAEARNGSLLMTWQPRMPVPDGLVAFNSVNVVLEMVPGTHSTAANCTHTCSSKVLSPFRIRSIVLSCIVNSAPFFLNSFIHDDNAYIPIRQMPEPKRPKGECIFKMSSMCSRTLDSFYTVSHTSS